MRPLFAIADVLSLSPGTPSEISASLVAAARRSPSARLYSAEPRSSQWPSMVTMKFGIHLEDSFQRAGVALQNRLIFAANIALVVIEVDVLHLLGQNLLNGRLSSGRRSVPAVAESSPSRWRRLRPCRRVQWPSDGMLWSRSDKRRAGRSGSLRQWRCQSSRSSHRSPTSGGTKAGPRSPWSVQR